MNKEFDMTRFTQKGKMQDAPKGQSVIAPINAGLRFIPNFVSIVPTMPGTGKSNFSSPLDITLERIWRKVKQDYYSKSADLRTFKLGSIFDTLCSSDIFVVGMVVKNEEGLIVADALVAALKNLAKYAKSEKASLHISEHLSDDVPALRELIQLHCADVGVNCYFYANQELKR